MGKNLTNNWKYNIPEFNISNKFTYFQDLLNHKQGNSALVEERKSSLYHEAQSAITSIGNLNTNSTIVTTALQFMKQVTESEREKELSILKNYKNELANKLPQQKEIVKILDRLERVDLNNSNELRNFYLDLTKAINLVRQDAEKYKQRLINLNNKTKKTFSDLFKDDYRFRSYSDIQSILTNLTGMATAQQRREESSFSSNLRRIISDYIMNNNIINLVSSGEDFAAIVAAITLDIEEAIQRELDKQKKSDFSDFTLKELKNIAESYASRSEQEQSRLQRALNQDKNDLQLIIHNTKDILGIQSLTGEEQRLKRRRSVSARVGKQKVEDSLYKRLAQTWQNNDIISQLKYINFTHKTNTSHGNIFELISTLLTKESGKVLGSAATDLITIGTITFNLEKTNAEKEIRQAAGVIREEYTAYAQNHKKDLDIKIGEQSKQMNEAIVATTLEIDNLLKQLEIPIEDLFIYHESLKLYGEIETGKAHAFHGRSMMILNFLDQLYSLNGIEGMVLPQRNAMTLVALNLSELAVGASMKEPLSKYFSVFAGLLMFDDIRNIALEAINQLSYSNVKNIHLYNLNGIYVPASMILSYTYEALMDASNEVAKGMAAQVTINTNNATETINKYLSNRNTNALQASDWPMIGSAVASGTTVQIAFLASFLQFIEDLASI